MHPNEPLNLQALQDELNQWRSTRTTHRIPSKLKARAVELLKDHKVSTVINTLGINSKMLKQWQQQYALAELPEPGFVSLPAISSCDVSHEPLSLALKISVSTPEGSALSLEGDLSLEYWHSAISLFSSLEKPA
jgi:hypothetical protein